MKPDIFDPQQHLALKARIGQVEPDSPRHWGNMTAHQMLVHCADAISYTLGGRPAKMRHNWLTRSFVKWMIFSGLVPFPKGKAKTFPEIAQDRSGSKPISFAEDKARLLGLLDELASRGPEGSFAVHPIFGPLSGRQWGRLTLIHLHHHLDQFRP